MKVGERFFQVAVSVLIGFLAVYSGCLIWSSVTGSTVGWVDKLQGKIVENCLSVTGSDGRTQGVQSKQEPLSWKEEVWQLACHALNWPIVLTEEEHTASTLPGQEGADMEKEAASALAKQEVQGENTGGTAEGIRPQIEAVTEEETVQAEVDDVDSESSMEAEGQEPVSVEAAAPVAASTGPVLLPVETQVRPEIAALPAIADLDMGQMLDFSYLLERLYVVNAGCSVTPEVLDPKTLLSKNLTITHSQEGYDILIYHTHSQEAFADSVPGDVAHTVVGLGNYLTSLLEEKGYRVLHCTDVFDMENGVLERDHAYDRALPVLEQILAENPSIQVVIDLHRDGVAEQVHLVTDVNGAPTARIMFFNGMCRDDTGERTDVTNPYREDNLAFSLQSALQLEAAYPGMLRVIYLKQSRYNQHLCSRSMLVEIGAQTNSVDEVYRAIPVVAETLEKVLQ